MGRIERGAHTAIETGGCKGMAVKGSSHTGDGTQEPVESRSSTRLSKSRGGMSTCLRSTKKEP